MTIHNFTTLLTHHSIGLVKKLMIRNRKSKNDLQVVCIKKVNQIYFQMTEDRHEAR